jgi:hypothetical protein
MAVRRFQTRWPRCRPRGPAVRRLAAQWGEAFGVMIPNRFILRERTQDLKLRASRLVLNLSAAHEKRKKSKKSLIFMGVKPKQRNYILFP